MARTEAQIQVEIAQIDATLSSMSSDPKPSYRIGDRSFDWNAYYNVLMQRREQLAKELSHLPAVEITEYDAEDR
jgi:hypothetical protein